MKIVNYGSLAIGLFVFDLALVVLWKCTLLPVEDVIFLSFVILFMATFIAWFTLDAWNRRLQERRNKLSIRRKRAEMIGWERR